MIKPHGLLVPVSSRVATFTHLAYQRGSLPRAFRVLRPSDVILGGAWRLDAFSAYRFRTQLPGATVDTITGILEVRCPQWIRTELSHDVLNPARVPL